MKSVSAFIKSRLHRQGWHLSRIDPRQVVPETAPDRELYARPQDLNRLFRPWQGTAFDAVVTAEVLRNTMLSRLKLYFLLKFIRQTLPLPGDLFEAGVGDGGSARLALNCLLQAGVTKPLWLLDTFAGYLKVDPERDGGHIQLHQCQCQRKDYVEQLLKNDQVPVHIIEGLIPATLAQVQTEKISFAHIDVNLHEPTLAATLFVLERMPPGGVVLFDDYNWPNTYGARTAIDEACARTGQEVISLPESTQAFLIKRA